MMKMDPGERLLRSPSPSPPPLRPLPWLTPDWRVCRVWAAAAAGPRASAQLWSPTPLTVRSLCLRSSRF